MALLANFLPEAEPKKQKPSSSSSKRKKNQKKKQPSSSSSSSWDQIKNLLTCKQVQPSIAVHDPSKNINNNVTTYTINSSSNNNKLRPCASICSFRDVVHGNTRVVHRPDYSPESSSIAGSETRLLGNKSSTTTRSNFTPTTSSSLTSLNASTGAYSSSSRGMQFRKLSGCYECQMIVDPSRYTTPRTTICACHECGEVFPKIESLELHQAVRHAVSELGPDDSGRNIVEIIFKSSWLKRDKPFYSIERILKVHNTKRTIQRFEDCRDAVKIRSKKYPRCAADGNELLRFYCTTLTCPLGARASSSLCASVPACGVCTIIRHGFQCNGSAGAADLKGVRTTASSGRAHDCLVGTDTRRAMLVCRVIAGRVKRMADDAAPEEESMTGSSAYDSLVAYAGAYSNLEELFVFNPRAILPCFVVIYKSTL